MAIDMRSDNDEDTLSFREIAVEAGKLMLHCVAQPPHLGGLMLVGPKKVMDVTIFGSDGRFGRRPLGQLALPRLGAANATNATNATTA